MYLYGCIQCWLLWIGIDAIWEQQIPHRHHAHFWTYQQACESNNQGLPFTYVCTIVFVVKLCERNYVRKANHTTCARTKNRKHVRKYTHGQSCRTTEISVNMEDVFWSLQILPRLLLKIKYQITIYVTDYAVNSMPCQYRKLGKR